MGSSDFLPPVRPHFVAFVWPYHLAPVVCSRIHQTLQLRARGIRAWLPRRQFLFSVEMTGPPRFLGDPHLYMPCSSTPAGSPRQAFAAIRCCLPPIEQRRHPQFSQFRGSITRPAHSLSTLRRMGFPECHARLASGWWLAFAGWGSHPLGPFAKFLCKVSEQPPFRSSPIAQASLAHPKYVFTDNDPLFRFHRWLASRLIRVTVKLFQADTCNFKREQGRRRKLRVP